MLPPGTLAALRGHVEGIVTVVALAIVSAAMAAGAPPQWAVSALAIALVLSHIRCRGRENHDEHGAQHKLDESLIRIAAIKARHKELLSEDQPTLGFEIRSRRSARGGRET